MKVLLAGPGTGKTAKIEEIVQKRKSGKDVLVISFTNATVEELKNKLGKVGVDDTNCMTLHKFAVKYNHDSSRHVLAQFEERLIKKISKNTEMSFDGICDFIQVTNFDQMIGRFVEFAKINTHYLKDKLAEYKILIVDEYQDFNPFEQALIDLLIELFDESIVLGDDDQCIYDFKDASSDKLIAFSKDNSNEKLEHLHICYRCPDIIVEKATKLIKNNKNRIDKEWKKAGNSGNLVYRQFANFSDVAEFIVSELKNKLSDKEKVLILSPVQFAVEDISKALDSAEIEFNNFFIGLVPQELMIKSWLLKSIEGDFKYANLLMFGYLNLKEKKKLYDLLKKQKRTGKNTEELLELVENVSVVLKSKLTFREVLETEEFKELKELFEKAEGITTNEKLKNLFRKIEKEVEKNIKIMSIHKSKGLDADHVFMVGLNEGILPNKKLGDDSIEGQRRIFYVGMTRARKNLYLLSNNKIQGKDARRMNFEEFKPDRNTRSTGLWNARASRFISEL